TMKPAPPSGSAVALARVPRPSSPHLFTTALAACDSAWSTMPIPDGFWIQTPDTFTTECASSRSAMAATTPTVGYTRGADLSGSLEGAGGIGGLLGRSDGYFSGNWTSQAFYHSDGNGSITYLVDSSQAVAA